MLFPIADLVPPRIDLRARERHAYLRDKWRPEGAFNLVAMDVSTDVLTPRVVGEYDTMWQGGWSEASGGWIGPRTLRVTFKYTDFLDGEKYERAVVGVISEDGTSLVWVNGASTEHGAHQLYTYVVWHRCELVPEKCGDSTVRYPVDYATTTRLQEGMILPHQIMGDGKYWSLLAANRSYYVDLVSGQQGTSHVEDVLVMVGNTLALRLDRVRDQPVPGVRHLRRRPGDSPARRAAENARAQLPWAVEERNDARWRRAQASCPGDTPGVDFCQGPMYDYAKDFLENPAPSPSPTWLRSTPPTRGRRRGTTVR